MITFMLKFGAAIFTFLYLESSASSLLLTLDETSDFRKCRYMIDFDWFLKQ